MPNNNKGSKNPNWKGGITKPKCEICGKIITYRAKRCSKHTDKNGKNNPKWRGGRVYTHEGYVQIFSPEHPNKNNYGYVLEHRLVIEENIGRFLNKEEQVHHINGIKDDNKIENLILFKNASEHQLHHYKIGTRTGHKFQYKKESENEQIPKTRRSKKTS